MPFEMTRASVDAERLVSQVVDYAIIALDNSGTIESWNAGAEVLKGYTQHEAVGRNFSMFYTEDDRRDGLPFQLLQRAREEGSVEHRGWRVRRDGTRFWGDVIITALYDDDGRLSGFAKVTRDLTAQHELELALRRSEERFRLLVGQVAEYAIIALDNSGTIESWNTGAELLKGYTSEQAIGRNFSMFYTADDRREGVPFELLDAARRHGSVEHTGWRVRRDGTRFWGDVIITALHDDEGRLSGFAKVTRDLTARKRLEEAQQSFFATFAHDFTTPITALRGYAEMLGEAPPERHQEFVARIQENADRLVSMMKELVSYSTVRSVAATMRLERLDLAALARRTVANLGSILDVDRVHLPETAPAVLGDLGAMERVLANLVTNALKYSTEGPVVVTATTYGDRVRITVADQGRGIDAADLPVIFDEFERGRLAHTDGGSGLGLASVKALVDQQGGRVWIDSAPGRGTVVTVEMPAG